MNGIESLARNQSLGYFFCGGDPAKDNKHGRPRAQKENATMAATTINVGRNKKCQTITTKMKTVSCLCARPFSFRQIFLANERPFFCCKQPFCCCLLLLFLCVVALTPSWPCPHEYSEASNEPVLGPQCISRLPRSGSATM